MILEWPLLRAKHKFHRQLERALPRVLGNMFIAILIIAVGVAADNLLVAKLSGCWFSIIHNEKLIPVLLLMFVVQSQILLFGEWAGLWLKPLLNGHQQWVALGILVSMSFNMLKEKSFRDRLTGVESEHSGDMLGMVFATSPYMLALGFTTRWLGVEVGDLKIFLLPLIAVFLGGGFLIGRYGLGKASNLLSALSPLLVLSGSSFLLGEKFLLLYRRG